MSEQKVVELRGSGLWSPDEVFDRCKEQWRVVAAAAEHLVREDSPALAEYALAVVLSQMTDSELQTGGMLPNGKTSPWLSANSTAVAHLLMHSHQLGLTPQSRFFRAKKAALLEATPPLDRPALVARFDRMEARLDDLERALDVAEGVRAGIEATRVEMERLVLELLGEGDDAA
jgi:hypothetical protein